MQQMEEAACFVEKLGELKRDSYLTIEGSNFFRPILTTMSSLTVAAEKKKVQEMLIYSQEHVTTAMETMTAMKRSISQQVLHL